MEPAEVIQVSRGALLVTPENLWEFPTVGLDVAVKEAEIAPSVIPVGRKLPPVAEPDTEHDEDPVINGLLVLINEHETVGRLLDGGKPGLDEIAYRHFGVQSVGRPSGVQPAQDRVGAETLLAGPVCAQ